MLYFCLFTFYFCLVHWQTSRRKLTLERPLVMGILNVTPDSFSDGGQFDSVDAALRRAEEMIHEGADIVDIGGESTRPGSKRIFVQEEIDRVVPVIEAIAGKFDVPISVDTCKSEVARAAVGAGAEIINDISGLRFDERIAGVAAEHDAGLIIMNSRGDFETLHSQPPLANIINDVIGDFQRALKSAREYRVESENIVLDVGIGFGKSQNQNLELIANVNKIIEAFPRLPIMVGASRKSFIGKLLDLPETNDRLAGSLAAAAIAAWKGASVLRVHDVRPTVQISQMVSALREARG
jgi:dihydropteroate synthase